MHVHTMCNAVCTYSVFRSNGACEALRSSGCLRLPSQRTLGDYTHYVDEMLMDTAEVGSCPEREKCTLLLLDEMHIREDLVFDKHTGTMIGFANLGEINDHLIQFERSLQDDTPMRPQLAKTIMVFMVRGLFSSLQFPYAQFPCAELSGELLYDPFLGSCAKSGELCSQGTLCHIVVGLRFSYLYSFMFLEQHLMGNLSTDD